MQKERFEIRNLQKSDIPDAMKLVYSEGWNQTENDWELFINHRGNVCKCAILNGDLIGTTTSYNYSNEVAWISMVLVQKEFRGLGVSKKLLNSVISELENCKSIKLDATPAGLKVYEKFGFVTEYTISRMVNHSYSGNETNQNKKFTNPMNSDVFTSLMEFDKKVFGADRSLLIKYWMSRFPGKCRVFLKENELMGFLAGREGNKFQHLGPLSAESTSVAIALINEVLKNRMEKPVIADVPDDKHELLEWLRKKGFKRQRGFSRMYFKNKNVFCNKGFQFLISGPEFG